VTLLADRDATIPVLNARTQHRSAAFGSGDEGQMELRFVAANADVKVGDTLLTSGVDGIYPAGVPVATVTSVNRQGEGGFAHIGLAPVAKTGGLRFVLLVGPLDKGRHRGGRGRGRRQRRGIRRLGRQRQRVRERAAMSIMPRARTSCCCRSTPGSCGPRCCWRWP
jgi:cell shape-determining protein MreC